MLFGCLVVCCKSYRNEETEMLLRLSSTINFFLSSIENRSDFFTSIFSLALLYLKPVRMLKFPKFPKVSLRV